MEASNEQFLILDCHLNPEDSEAEARGLVLKLRPHWESKDVMEKSIPPGFLNKVHCFHLASDEELKDAVLVRIFQDLFDGVVNRDTEVKAIQLANATGCCGRLEAVFGNGIVYPFLRGNYLQISQLSDPKIINMICGHLAAFHTQNPRAPWLKDLKGNPSAFPEKCDFFDRGCRTNIRRTAHKLHDPEQDAIFQKHRMSVDQLESELSFLQSQIEEFNFDLCVSHGDLQRRNIIHDKVADTISIIDYELSGMLFEGYDLAYLFANTPVFDGMERRLFHGEPLNVIPDDVKELWLRGYVNTKHRLLYGSESIPTEARHRLFKLQVEVLEVLMIFNDICSIQYVAGLSGFTHPFIGILPRFKEIYFSSKKKIEQIKKEYFAIKHKL